MDLAAASELATDRDRKPYGARGWISRGMMLLISAAAWTPCARAATQPGDMPRAEYFVEAGAAGGSAGGVGGNQGLWPAMHAGGAYLLTRTVAIGVAAGWHFMGATEQWYAPPGADILVTGKESFTVAPVIGYLKLRLPTGSHGGTPYVSAGAGAYYLRLRARAPGMPSSDDVRLGYDAAVGLAGKPGDYFPQVELRYDSRTMQQAGFSTAWPDHRLWIITLSVGLQMP